MPQARKTFVVQLDAGDAVMSEPAFRGWVEELDSGSATQFDSSAALVAFLLDALRRVAPAPGET